MLNNLYQRWTRMNAGQNPVNASDVSDDIVTTPSTAFRFAAGTGTMVTGTATIATGLTSVVAFVADFTSSGAGTGTSGNQQIYYAATTGSVLATAFYISAVGASGAVAAASGSTGTFAWFAVGT